MEMRHGMPVWAPTDVDMREIRRRVSRERAKAAADLVRQLRRLFAGAERTPATVPGALPAGCGQRG